jgi:uncharacterized protein
MIHQPLFWFYLFFLFQFFIYFTNRVTFHPPKTINEFLWVPSGLLGASTLLAAATFFLHRQWDFSPAGLGVLATGWKIFLAVWSLWVLCLWMDHAFWLLFRKKPVVYRLVRRWKVEIPAEFRTPFSFLKYVGFENQFYRPEVVEYEVELPGWPREFSGLSLAQVSDIHMGRHVSTDYVKILLAEAAKLKPDFYALTGDFIESKKDIPHLRKLFKGLKAPLGVYALLGNHDYWAAGAAVEKALKEEGLNVLRNRAVLHRRKGKTLAILGADDLWMGEKNEQAILGAKADAKVFLAHHPDHFKLGKKAGVHLQVSGHCHGGQICFPLIGPLIVPSKDGRKYARGFFRENDTVLFVNRGIDGFPPIRTFCRPEIVKLILKPA